MRCPGLCSISLLGLLLSVPWLSASADSRPAVVILIDDMGDNYERCKAAVDLPGPLNFAFLPHSPFAAKLAKDASRQGQEVILHAPMENTHHRPLGPGALTRDLSEGDYLSQLQNDLDSVPGAVGMNNHMGSLLTTLKLQMEWTMDVVLDNRLFFIDSRTTAESVAWKVARQRGIPYLQRDVFLDHERTLEFIHQQFEKTLEIARREGFAVAIGHPHRVTVQYLQWALPQLDTLGFRLVKASELIAEQRNSQQLLAAKPREYPPHSAHNDCHGDYCVD